MRLLRPGARHEEAALRAEGPHADLHEPRAGVGRDAHARRRVRLHLSFGSELRASHLDALRELGQDLRKSSGSCALGMRMPWGKTSITRCMSLRDAIDDEAALRLGDDVDPKRAPSGSTTTRM